MEKQSVAPLEMQVDAPVGIVPSDILPLGWWQRFGLRLLCTVEETVGCTREYLVIADAVACSVRFPVGHTASGPFDERDALIGSG